MVGHFAKNLVGYITPNLKGQYAMDYAYEERSRELKKKKELEALLSVKHHCLIETQLFDYRNKHFFLKPLLILCYELPCSLSEIPLFEVPMLDCPKRFTLVAMSWRVCIAVILFSVQISNQLLHQRFRNKP